MDIGEKIKTLRCDMNLTQEELALAAKTTKQTIHKYETGIIENIPASKIKAIADRLNTTPAYLMGWELPDKAEQSELSEREENINRLLALTDEEWEKVDAFVQGLLANR